MDSQGSDVNIEAAGEDGVQIFNRTEPSSLLSSKENLSVDQLYARIHHLEDVLAGKEATILAVTQELDAVREMSCIDASIGPLPTGFNADFKASVDEYNRKLQEHASAICQRDEVIQKLTDSLKQSVRVREELKKEAGRLSEELHFVSQHVQQPQTKLLEALKEKDIMLQKKSAELIQCKAQSSKEVQFLMSSLEEMQQQAAKSSSVSPSAFKCHGGSNCKFSEELKDLQPSYDALKAQVEELMSFKGHLETELAAVKKKYCQDVEELILSKDELGKDLSLAKLKHCDEVKEFMTSQNVLKGELSSMKEKHFQEFMQLTSSYNRLKEEHASLVQKHLEEMKKLSSFKDSLEKELSLVKQKHFVELENLTCSKECLEKELASIKQEHFSKVEKLIASEAFLKKELESVKEKGCIEVEEHTRLRDCLEKELALVKQNHFAEVKELLNSKESLEKEFALLKFKYDDAVKAESKNLVEKKDGIVPPLKPSSLSVDEEAVQVLIAKCQDDIKFLDSFLQSVSLLQENKLEPHEVYSEISESNSTKGLTGLSLFLSRLFSLLDESKERNTQLENDIFELQSTLAQVQNKVCQCTKISHKCESEVLNKNCNCSKLFQEEKSMYKTTIEILQKEVLEKEVSYVEKLANILKKSRNSNQTNLEIEDNFVNLVNEYSHKSKEIVVLQSQLRGAQLECRTHASENERLVDLQKRIQVSLEESLQECYDLKGSLQNALTEKNMLQARLNRAEILNNLGGCGTNSPINLLWQLLDELASPKSRSVVLEVPKVQVSVVEKIQSGLKIINKMNTDCEALLGKFQPEDKNVPFCCYLQSEALGLRRLQTALLDIDQAIISNSGPALQLHVDVLKHHLKNEKLLYQSMCEAHYSLEAEMRDKEEQFKLREALLLQEISTQKIACKLWQLKSQGWQVQVESLKATEVNGNENLMELLVELDETYSQVLSAFHYEVERVASLRESKVRLDMTEKVSNLERDHRQQLVELSRHIQTESTVRALQTLHQQEIEAVRAECDFALFKAIHTRLDGLPSALEHPPKVRPGTSCSEISLLFMKHYISSRYRVALSKISSPLQKDLLDKLDCVDEVLKSICGCLDQELKVSKTVNESKAIECTEELICEAEELGKKLLEMQRNGLKAILRVCEDNHKQIVLEVQKLMEEVENLGNVKELQEELLRTREQQRLAVESLSASHKAEVSRLRLLLSQRNTLENSDSNETALTVLRRELEEKHKRQMEELRTYFEQKCADFEKHYSEEVFSQHSRKLSDCSSASESELVSEMYYAGPGTSICTNTGAPSYFSELLGECNYRDSEKQIQTVDVGKLFADNQEQIETMRLALESRHQGELEAQKELYEVRVEELLRNMSDSHAAELKLQSKCLQDLQDTEISLNRKLLQAREDITALKAQLNEHKGLNAHNPFTPSDEFSPKTQPKLQSQPESTTHCKELEDELRRMSDMQKCKDSENSAQIASLKTKLRENHDVMCKLEKDLSNLQFKYTTDMQCLTSSINEKEGEIHELNLKVKDLSSKLEESNHLKTELEFKMNAECVRQKEEFENMVKKKDMDREELLREFLTLKSQYAENLQVKELEQQKVLEERLINQVEEKKKQLDSEYAVYLDFVKKCADDTKIQLMQTHGKEIKQLIDRYEGKLALLQSSTEESSKKYQHMQELTVETPKNALQETISKEMCLKESSLSNCFHELFLLSSQLSTHQQEQLERIITKVFQEETLCKEKLHQDLELRLEHVQKECERRFHLQLEEARSDIVRALEHQIQQLLDDNTDLMEKPAELQQLEKKFANNYHEKLSKMQKDYETKISEMCAKHASQMSHVRSKNNVADDNAINAEDLDKLLQERDCLRNVAAALRDVVAELVRYFMSWEDDFNNTLMDELAKFDTSRDNILSVTQNEESVQEQTDTIEKNSTDDEIPVIIATPAKSKKRVCFSADISGILSLIDDGFLLESVGLNCSIRDASLNIQAELDRCLARLRSDSAALYALSKPVLVSSGQENVPHIVDENVPERSSPGKLPTALQLIENLRKEKEKLETQLEILGEEHKRTVAEFRATQQLLRGLQEESRRHAEVVAEGYGEGEPSLICDVPGSPQVTSVEEFHKKAQALLLRTSNSDEVSGVVSPSIGAHLPHMLEELCRDWEHLAEESRHKQDDLQQQVDAVDKQLRATRAFLDEQAAEREQERDDFVQEIKRLQELIRDKDRDRSSQQLKNHEVETLESQLKEANATLKDMQEKLEKLTAEHKKAVEKIWTLRDIISDLELQVATKAEEAASALAQNKALQEMLEQQGQTQLQLAQEMEELQMFADNRKLVEKVSLLEEQLRRYQVLAEQLGDPCAIDQMKIQLHELSADLELHTRELECANASCAISASPCLSSPSEDVSIRETIEAIRTASESSQGTQRPTACLVLPLHELSQVMDQWQKHVRADDAVLKKIRDLDMQLDDLQAEKDTLVASLQDQMLVTSSVQVKLDEHRMKADLKLSESRGEMQSQIEDLRSEIQIYVDTLDAREKQIQNLRVALHQAENNLRCRETEVRKSAEAERNVVTQLQLQVSKLSADKAKLQAMISEKDAMHVSLPSLVESMLLDKNADIDRLETQVQHLSKQMESRSHYVATPSTTLEFEYCESEKVRAHVTLSPVLELQRSVFAPVINESDFVGKNNWPNETAPSMQKVSFDSSASQLRLDFNDSMEPVPLEETEPRPNLSTSVTSDILSLSADTLDTLSLSSSEKRIAVLEEKLLQKDETIKECREKLRDNVACIAEVDLKCQYLKDCEPNIGRISEDEIKAIKLELERVILNKNLDEKEFERICQNKDAEIQELTQKVDALQILATQEPSTTEKLPDEPVVSLLQMQSTNELQAKESEIQRLKSEVCATQAILANLQRKVQEAKQIVRSPIRSSPDNRQALRAIQNELEAAKQEIVELKNLCRSIRSEVELEAQEKQAQFVKLLSQEQKTKASLEEALDKVQRESNAAEALMLQEQLKETIERAKELDGKNQKLQAELKQLNMECITLRQQLSTPVNEALALANKLDAEKKFADALKDELFHYKSLASSLDEECKILKDRLSCIQKESNADAEPDLNHEQKEKLLNEVAQLKSTVEILQKDQCNFQNRIQSLVCKNAFLQEENEEVGKELSDTKQRMIHMHGVKASLDEAHALLQSKIKELNESKLKNEGLSMNLSALRHALKNLHGNINCADLPDEDRDCLSEIQRKLCCPSLKGAGDGPWNKLAISDTAIYEITPNCLPIQEAESLDDLTDLVQHEVDMSVQLDQSLLQTIDSSSSKKAGVATGLAGQKKEKTLHVSDCSISHLGNTSGQTISIIDHESQLKINQLEAEISVLKAQYYELQQQDCSLIQEMRLKLSEALDAQAALHSQLEKERTKPQISVVEKKDVLLSPMSKFLSSSDPSREELQAQLIETTCELTKLRTEKDAAEKQFRRLQEVDVQRSRRRHDTEQKHRRHIEQLQTQLLQTQQECKMLHQELSAANQKLHVTQEEFVKDRNTQLKNHTPFVERLKKMNTFLEEHIEENQRMAKQMEDLTEEHGRLRSRIAQLEGQLARSRSNESFETASARFAAERAEWEAEQKLLLLELNEAKQKRFSCADSDVEERVTHLFGRYLRMQSYRKALTWQKRYLLSVITGINDSKNLAATHLAVLAETLKEKKPKPLQNFRSAALAVIAIHRMQFMVQRWLRGKRIGCGVVVQQSLTHTQFAFSSSVLGQGQQLSSGCRSSSQHPQELTRCGLSQSPPTLERPRQPRPQTASSSQLSRFHLNSRGLASSSTLSDCMSNFNAAQQHFDALLSNPPK